LSVFEHAVINVIISLLNSFSILVSLKELPFVYLVIRSAESILAVSCHLPVLPLPLIALSGCHHLFHSYAILLIVLELAFIDIAIIVYDLADSFDRIIIPNTFINSATLIDQPSDTVLDHDRVDCEHFAFIYVSISVMDDLDVILIDCLIQ